MLKIRLMRIGGKQRPFYRVVVLEERSKRTGAYVENLGTYNPLTEPKEIKLNQERIDYWIKKGAQPSTGYLRIIGKAPQRPPRKAKRPSDGGNKEKKEAPAAEPAQEKQQVEEPKSEEQIDQIKSEDQQVSEPVEQKDQATETQVTTEQTDTPISSDVSEPESEKKDEGSA